MHESMLHGPHLLHQKKVSTSISIEGIFYKILFKKLEGFFYKNALKINKNPSKSIKIIGKFPKLRNSISHKIQIFSGNFLHWIKNLIVYLLNRKFIK